MCKPTTLLRAIALGVAGAILMAPYSFASPITYTETVTASGSLGATSFSNKLVTLTLTNVDTNNVQNPSSGFYSIGGSVTVTVDGIGSGTFTDPTVVFSNNNHNIVGFEDTNWFSTNTALDVLTDNSSLFAGYNLKSAIGPLSGTAGIAPSEPFPSTAGNFVLTSSNVISTFTAEVAVPAPFIGYGLSALLTVGVFLLSARFLQHNSGSGSHTA